MIVSASVEPKGEVSNTPGHVQHFGQRALEQLLSQHFPVVRMTSSLPWIAALCSHR